MESSYKKITRKDIDFPNYCYFFIKEIMDSLEEQGIKNPDDELSLTLETYYHPYCYDALMIIVKTFERMGFYVKIPSYQMDIEDGVRLYTYKWHFKKKPNLDDLPF